MGLCRVWRLCRIWRVCTELSRACRCVWGRWALEGCGPCGRAVPPVVSARGRGGPCGRGRPCSCRSRLVWCRWGLCRLRGPVPARVRRDRGRSGLWVRAGPCLGGPGVCPWGSCRLRGVPCSGECRAPRARLSCGYGGPGAGRSNRRRGVGWVGGGGVPGAGWAGGARVPWGRCRPRWRRGRRHPILGRAWDGAGRRWCAASPWPAGPWVYACRGAWVRIAGIGTRSVAGSGFWCPRASSWGLGGPDRWGGGEAVPERWSGGLRRPGRWSGG